MMDEKDFSDVGLSLSAVTKGSVAMWVALARTLVDKGVLERNDFADMLGLERLIADLGPDKQDTAEVKVLAAMTAYARRALLPEG